MERFFYYGLYFGWTGVDLFFSLSGFLITGILLNSRNSPRYFSTFYARRSLRIFPLYFLMIAVMFFAVPRVSVYKFTGLGWYLIYAQNWIAGLGATNHGIGHLWSLAVEEQFYVVWPLVVWLTPRKRLPAVCISIAIASAVLRCVFARVGLQGLIYESTVTRMDGLVLGGLAAFAFQNPLWREWLLRKSKSILLTSLACVTGSFLAGGNMDYNPYIVNFGALPLAVFFSTGVAVHPSRALKAVWLGRVGQRAYAMYLLHVPLAALFGARFALALSGASGPVRVVCGLLYMVSMTALSYLLAGLSKRFFEDPINALKRQFTY